MSTYDLTSSIPSSSNLQVGDILNCPYSGSYINLTLPAGAFTFDVWGAEGGIYNATAGTSGKGGYSTGDILLTEDTSIYLYAGGAGSVGSSASTSTHSGGYNGGGTAYSYAGSGGGGSDIRINSTSLYARVIVAGGGGGGAYSSNRTAYSVLTGGAGGGESGTFGGYGSQNAGPDSSTNAASPGTQTAAGANSTNAGTGATAASFGEGAGAYYYSASYASGAGGGGWYGGGVGRYYYAAGAGGSGYIYTSSTASNYPSGCLLNSDYYLTNAGTLDGTHSFLSPTGTSETGHTGNGYIRITVISLGNVEEYEITSSTTSQNLTIVPNGSSNVLEGSSYNLYIYGADQNHFTIYDNNVDVTNNSVYTVEDITGAMGKIQSGYDTTDYSYSSISNIENAYTGASNSSYATIACNTSTSSETYIYFTFDLSDIPENATIDSVSVITRASITSTSRMSSYTVQPFCGSTSKATAQSLSTSYTDFTITLDSCTREELQDLKLKFYAKRSSSSGGGGSSSVSMYIYGGSVTVNYTIPNGNEYILYTLNNINSDHNIVIMSVSNELFIKVNNSWVNINKIYVKENNNWIEEDLTYLSTNSIQYLLQGD